MYKHATDVACMLDQRLMRTRHTGKLLGPSLECLVPKAVASRRCHDVTSYISTYESLAVLLTHPAYTYQNILYGGSMAFEQVERPYDD